MPPRHVTFDSLSNPTLVPRSIGYPPLPNATWTITASCCGYGPFSEDAVANASRHHGGLFDFPCGWPTMPFVGEWGYEFHHNQNNIFPICGNLTAAGYSSPPANRDDALARLHRYWECRVASARASVNKTVSDPAFSMIGHYFYAGLSAAFGDGPVIPGTEIGENINSINAHLAFSRGAARQFGHAFIVDFSAWMGGFIRDFSTSRFWGPASSPVGGHSTSLFRRAYFASFMAGAGGVSMSQLVHMTKFFSAVITRNSLAADAGSSLSVSMPTLANDAVTNLPYLVFTVSKRGTTSLSVALQSTSFTSAKAFLKLKGVLTSQLSLCIACTDGAGCNAQATQTSCRSGIGASSAGGSSACGAGCIAGLVAGLVFGVGISVCAVITRNSWLATHVRPLV